MGADWLLASTRALPNRVCCGPKYAGGGNGAANDEARRQEPHLNLVFTRADGDARQCAIGNGDGLHAFAVYAYLPTVSQGTVTSSRELSSVAPVAILPAI